MLDPQPPVESRTLGSRATLIVIAVSLVVIFALLGYRATLTEHEVFAAQPAREMLDGGSLVLQPFAGAFRVKKPPGQSWLIALSLVVTRTHNEYTARLPSAVAATGLALLLGSMGARLVSRRVGLIAGLMTLTTLGVQARARLAEADMALALSITGCFAAILWALHRDTDRTRDLEEPPAPPPPARRASTLAPAGVFWLSLVAGVFLKGPIPLGFVLLPIVVAYILLRWLVHERSAASILRRTVLHPIPLVVAAIVVGVWLTSALRLLPDAAAAWRHEVVARASGEMRRDLPIAYLWMVPHAALPWFPFAVVALAGGADAWRRAVRTPAILLLTLWFGVGFVMISCVALKALHYTLPILPPLILLSAVGFDRVLERFAARRAIGHRAALARAALIGWFGIVSIGWLVNQLVIEPRRDRGELVKRFADEVERIVPSGEPIYFVGVGEERTAWYLSRRLIQTRLREDEPLITQAARLPSGVPVYVLCRLPQVPALRAMAEVELLADSANYRGRADDVERRSLVKVTTGGTGEPQTDLLR